MHPTRPVSWLKAARTAFLDFPSEVQRSCFYALTIAAEGGKADTAKPFKGVGPGVFEIALAHRGNAYRLVYAVQLGTDLVVIDAFQKKSKRASGRRRSTWIASGIASDDSRIPCDE